MDKNNNIYTKFHNICYYEILVGGFFFRKTWVVSNNT